MFAVNFSENGHLLPYIFKGGCEDADKRINKYERSCIKVTRWLERHWSCVSDPPPYHSESLPILPNQVHDPDIPVVSALSHIPLPCTRPIHNPVIPEVSAQPYSRPFKVRNCPDKATYGPYYSKPITTVDQVRPPMIPHFVTPAPFKVSPVHVRWVNEGGIVRRIIR